MADQNAASQPGAFQTAPNAPIQNANTPTVPIMAPDNTIHMIPQDSAQQAIAAGGRPVSKVISPAGNGDVHWVPHDQLDAARKAGGTVVNPDGSFLVTPMEGEDFGATMQRAATIGKSVSPELIRSETSKAVRQVPATIATAYGIGAALPAAEAAATTTLPAAPAYAGGAAEGLEGAAATGQTAGMVQKAKAGISALKALSEEHPLLSNALRGAAWYAGGEGTLKSASSLYNLLKRSL